MRSYTIHWRYVSYWLPGIVIFIYRHHQTGQNDWLLWNLFMVLALLCSIRREEMGLEDDWLTEEHGDYLRYRGGPLDARPVMWRGTDNPMGEEVVDSGTMLLPIIEMKDGQYVLNRERRRYDWAPARSAANNKSPSD